MPLLKLWNAIKGLSTGANAVATDGANPSRDPSNDCDAAKSTRAKHAATGSLSSGFGLFGGKPHGELCKLVRRIQARSVLEVGVGDGSRAIAVMETLSQRVDSVQYYGIDQFELTDGGLSLREFHQKMRAAGIRPQIFPESLETGLMKFLHRIGKADLVLLTDAENSLVKPRVVDLLDRLSTPRTSILCQSEDGWSPFSGVITAQRRAA